MNKRELSKRSQVSIFIIIAIVIVAIIGLFFMFRGSPENKPTSQIFDISSFKPYVDECLRSVSKEAVFSIGEHGGYYFVPENSLNYISYNVPIYMDKKEKFVPSKEVVEKELGSYIKDALPICFDYFSGFKASGYSVSLGEIQISPKIKEDSIDINAKIPLTIKKGESTNEYEDFSTTVKPVYLPKLLALSNDIVNEEAISPESICLTCIDEEADKYGVEIELIETPINNEFIYSIKDSQSNLTTNETLKFSFAARYDFPECKNTEECFNELQ